MVSHFTFNFLTQMCCCFTFSSCDYYSFLILFKMTSTYLQESKTVGADVNWGVRFKDIKDVSIFLCYVSYFYICKPYYIKKIIQNVDIKLFQCEHFLINLCKEVSLRLQGCGVQGRTFTLKVLVYFQLYKCCLLDYSEISFSVLAGMLLFMLC